MTNQSILIITAVYIISVMGFLLQTSFAQETHNTADTDEQVIRSLEEKERCSVLNQDFQKLEQLWSEHFMVNTPINQVTPNRSVVLDIFRQGLAHYTSFDRSIEHIRIDGDIAIVRVQSQYSQPAMLLALGKRYTVGTPMFGSGMETRGA